MRERRTWPPNTEQARPAEAMRVPRPERRLHGQRGVDEERLGGRAGGVEKVECRVADP